MWGDVVQVIEQLLRAGADATLCNPQGRTALHACPPDLQGALLGWMLRPHLPPQAGLWRAAWLGDLRTLRQLLVGRLYANYTGLIPSILLEIVDFGKKHMYIRI